MFTACSSLLYQLLQYIFTFLSCYLSFRHQLLKGSYCVKFTPVSWYTVDTHTYFVSQPLLWPWLMIIGTMSPTQKNMEKQSNSIKGSSEVAGFLLLPISRWTQRSCSRSRKRQTRRKKNPSTFVALSPTHLPFTCMPRCARGQSHHTVFPLVVLKAPRTDSLTFVLSLQ